MNPKTKESLIYGTITFLIIAYNIAAVVFSVLHYTVVAIALWIPPLVFLAVGLPIIFCVIKKKNKKQIYEEIARKKKPAMLDKILLEIKSKEFETNFLKRLSPDAKLYSIFRNAVPEIKVTAFGNSAEIFFEKTYSTVSIDEEGQKPILFDVKYNKFEDTVKLYSAIILAVTEQITKIKIASRSPKKAKVRVNFFCLVGFDHIASRKFPLDFSAWLGRPRNHKPIFWNYRARVPKI